MTKSTGVGRPNPLATKTVTVSPELAAVIGKGPVSRPQVVKKIWEFIKANKIQDGRMILPKGTALEKVLGAAPISMTAMNKKENLGKHINP